MAYCDNCEHRKKLKYSTMFFCENYRKTLEGNPPVRLEECTVGKRQSEREEISKPQNGNRARKKYIEVK